MSIIQKVCPQLSKVTEPSCIADAELVILAQGGDQDAFTALVQRYHARIFNTVYALVGDRDDADDLAQSVFLKAYRSLSSYQCKAQFYTWLHRIAINTFLDWQKSPKRQKVISLEREYVESEVEPIGWITSPEASDHLVQQKELQVLLGEALAALSPEYRITLVLRELDGYNYYEIAEIMGCSVGTVKSRLFRARSQLKKLWQNRFRKHLE